MGMVVSASASYGAAGPTTTPRALAEFADSLGKRVGEPFVARTFLDYAELMRAVERRRVDVAWLPPLVAIRAFAKGWAVPVALPLRNGSSAFSTALFCREDSPWRSVHDLHALRAAWVDPRSAAGYLVTRAALQAKGIDPDHAFDRESFLGDHAAVVQAVETRFADVGSTFVALDEDGRVLRAGWGKRSMRILLLAGPIPSDFLAASVQIPPALIDRVRDALVETPCQLLGAGKALFDADGFEAVAPEYLNAFTSMLADLNVRELDD
jgi:phosphate/phosphite/phosphonate ABC transporter binding protein